MRSSSHSQRGVAFLTFVALLSALCILFVVSQSAWLAKQRNSELPEIRRSRVTQAAEAVRAWYARNAASIDSLSPTLPSDGVALLAEAGIPRQWQLNAAISNPLTRGNIKYRVIAVWGEGEDNQSPSFDPTTGKLILCPDTSGTCDPTPRPSARVEGFEIQASNYATTLKNLSTLAAAAQAYFTALRLSDPDHNVSLNYFRSCEVSASQIPCLDSYEDIASTSLLSELGEPALLVVDAWGNALTAMNGGALASTSPYRMGFQATTPWGDPLLVYAFQKL